MLETIRERATLINIITDYGVLMELFIDVLVKKDKELAHKSFIKKITNKLDRYHKRRIPQCAISEQKAKKALYKVEQESDETQISLGALCWLIYNKHQVELKPYGFDKKPFEEMNKHFNAQGVIMQTARIVTKIEEAMND